MHIIKAILGIDVSEIRKWGQNGSGKKDRKRTNDSMVKNLRLWLPLQL